MHAPRQNPVVLGHEATGTVVAAGRRVNHVMEGDTTSVTWVPRNAPRTKRRPDPATVRVAGGAEAMSQNVFCWADHTIADEQFVVKVPDTIQKDVTAIIGCAVITGAGAVKNTARVKPALPSWTWTSEILMRARVEAEAGVAARAKGARTATTATSRTTTCAVFLTVAHSANYAPCLS